MFAPQLNRQSLTNWVHRRSILWIYHRPCNKTAYWKFRCVAHLGSKYCISHHPLSSQKVAVVSADSSFSKLIKRKPDLKDRTMGHNIKPPSVYPFGSNLHRYNAYLTRPLKCYSECTNALKRTLGSYYLMTLFVSFSNSLVVCRYVITQPAPYEYLRGILHLPTKQWVHKRAYVAGNITIILQYLLTMNIISILQYCCVIQNLIMRVIKKIRKSLKTT